MRKILISFAALVVYIASMSAAFTIDGVNFRGIESEIDTVFMVASVDDAYLVFNDSTAHNIKWFTHAIGDKEPVAVSEESEVLESKCALAADSTMGYLAVVDDTIRYWIWVFDHSRTAVHLDSIVADTDVEERCSYIRLTLGITAPELQYDTVGQNMWFEIHREFEIEFDSCFYISENFETKRTVRKIGDVVDYPMESPLVNTTYTLRGDQFEQYFGDIPSIESDEVVAQSVEMHVLASIRTREDATNELDRGDPSDPDEEKTNMQGSAPVSLEMLNYSSPAAFFYEWEVSLDRNFDGSKVVASNDKDFRFTFDAKGTYYIRIRTSNNAASEDSTVNCMVEKVYKLDVLESFIDVPNVFTPNDDGKNDEFKVAYRSLVSFKAKVFNSWGRLVYSWNDPSIGWDGTINGKPAAAGAYFYIIEAEGSDRTDNGEYVKYLKRGDINLLR